MRLDIPPLSDRRVDIPLLINYFIEKHNRERNRHVLGVSSDAMCALIAYDYPGNVRELENIIARAFIMNKSSVITTRALSPDVTDVGEPDDHPDWGPLERAEADAILEALAAHGGHRERTAESLGIHKTTLIRKMNRLGITFQSSAARRKECIMRIDRAVLWRAQCAAIILGGTWVVLDTWSGAGVNGHMAVNVLVGGTAIAVGFSVGRCRHWCGFVMASIGIWLSMSAFNPQLVLEPGLKVNNLIVGPVLALAGLISVVFVEAPQSPQRERPDLRLVSRLQRRGAQ